jgi:hypothetical protein
MVVCLQETKITSWTYSLLVETVGTDMAQNFVALPSIGASGGILIAVSARFFCLDDPHLTTNTVSASLRMLADNTKWSISGVYGPQSD